MRLANDAAETRSWVIEEIAPDFELLDVWALPVTGARGEFDSFVEMVASFDPAAVESALVRALFEIRRRVGGVLGWDDAGTERPIPGCEETTLRDRLPRELRNSAPGPDTRPELGGFRRLYRTDAESAIEISNATVHGVVHLAWVHLGGGRYGGEMRIYVKARGALGAAYLKLIQPFRHVIVYPALIRQIGRAWATRAVPAFAREV